VFCIIHDKDSANVKFQAFAVLAVPDVIRCLGWNI
jgi:hypothetical protein